MDCGTIAYGSKIIYMFIDISLDYTDIFFWREKQSITFLHFKCDGNYPEKLLHLPHQLFFFFFTDNGI